MKAGLSTFLEDFHPVQQVNSCENRQRPNHSITLEEFGSLPQPLKWVCHNGSEENREPLSKRCNVFGNFKYDLVELYSKYREEMLAKDFMIRKDLRNEASIKIQVLPILLTSCY